MTDTITFIFIVIGCLVVAWVLTLALLMALLWALSGIFVKLNKKE